jgi:hypothetical protein
MVASELLAFGKQVGIAAGDVYVEDELQSLRPGQWRGGRIDAVAA